MADSNTTSPKPICLEVVGGQDDGARYVGSDPQIRIGRERKEGDGIGSLVIAHDAHCSRDHCMVLWRGGRWLLADAGSRAGTYIRGARLAPTSDPVPLEEGEFFIAAATVVQFSRVVPVAPPPIVGRPWDPASVAVIKHAMALAGEGGVSIWGVEDLFLSLVESGKVELPHGLRGRLSADMIHESALRRRWRGATAWIADHLETHDLAPAGEPPGKVDFENRTPRVDAVFGHAGVERTRAGASKITPQHLFAAIMREGRSLPAHLFGDEAAESEPDEAGVGNGNGPRAGAPETEESPTAGSADHPPASPEPPPPPEPEFIPSSFSWPVRYLEAQAADPGDWAVAREIMNALLSTQAQYRRAEEGARAEALKAATRAKLSAAAPERREGILSLVRKLFPLVGDGASDPGTGERGGLSPGDLPDIGAQKPIVQTPAADNTPVMEASVSALKDIFKGQPTDPNKSVELEGLGVLNYLNALRHFKNFTLQMDDNLKTAFNDYCNVAASTQIMPFPELWKDLRALMDRLNEQDKAALGELESYLEFLSTISLILFNSINTGFSKFIEEHICLKFDPAAIEKECGGAFFNKGKCWDLYEKRARAELDPAELTSSFRQQVERQLRAGTVKIRRMATRRFGA